MLPRRRTRDDAEGIRFGQRDLDPRADLRQIVPHRIEPEGLPAPFANEGGDHPRVELDDVSWAQFVAGLDQLTPGRQDRHDGPRSNDDFVDPGGQERADVVGPHPVPAGQQRLARHDVLPDQAHVLPRGGGAAQMDRLRGRAHDRLRGEGGVCMKMPGVNFGLRGIAAPVVGAHRGRTAGRGRAAFGRVAREHAFDHHDGVRPGGQGVAGIDVRERSLLQPGRALLERDGTPLARAERVLGAQRDPVHRSAVVVRDAGLREDRLRGHTAECIIGRHDLGGGETSGCRQQRGPRGL